ncbi:MAG: peptidoglycan-associated lipoprotein Pal [Pseudomonadota bacterium]
MKGMSLVSLGAAASLMLVAGCASNADSSASIDDQASSRVGGESGGPVPGSMEDFVVNAGNRVFYAFDRYDLSSDAQATLQRQAAWLNSYPATSVRVEGNCDERGTREYNLALGARRANAAKDYLVGLGVDPARISTISYGKERPIDPRSTDEAWALNRNATTVIAEAGL